MKDNILFSEQQKFNQWWLWLLLLALNASFIFGIYTQIFEKRPFGDNPTSNTGLWIGFGIIVLVTAFFLTIKLQTIIKNDGIYVRFFPIHIGFRKFSWDRLEKAYVRQYSPLTEYGGWGLRLGIFGKGNALNISGNKGLQLVIMNRPALLIGTKKPEEIKEILSEIGQYKS